MNVWCADCFGDKIQASNGLSEPGNVKERFFVNSTIETTVLAGLRVHHVIPAKKRFSILLLFIHGMWSTGKMFIPLMRILGDLGFECYAVDQSGHGDSFSGNGTGKISLDEHIGKIKQVISELGRPVIVIGHSMGATAASNACVGEPLVKGFVVMTGVHESAMTMLTRVIGCIWRYALDLRDGGRINLRRKDAATMLFNTMCGHRLEVCLDKLEPESGLVASELLTGKYQIERLNCPMLVIGGKRDRMTSNQVGLAEKFSADYREVDACHMAMLDPNRIQAAYAIIGWLKEEFGGEFVR